MTEKAGHALRGLASYGPTQGAAALSAASSAAIAALGGWGAAQCAIALGAGIMSLIAWAMLAQRSNGYGQHLRKRHEARSAKHKETIKALDEALKEIGARQGAEQLALIERKMQTLRSVLLQRLDEGEITFHRYLRTAEQVYLSGLDNLNELKVASTALAAIDTAYLARRAGETSNEAERSAIAERVGHAKALNTKIEGLLTQNEQIMSALDATTVALAQTQIGPGAAAIDADSAMGELARLAARTKRYQHQG